MKSSPIRQCRICTSKRLTRIVNLGSHAVSSFVIKKTSVPTYPLALSLCKQCGLVQLAHTAVSPESLYRKYWYKSGVNQSMRDALSDVITSTKKRVHLKKNDIVVDIGANDGTLLGFWGHTVTRVGFEPAKNLVSEAKSHATHIINDFFSHKAFMKISQGKKASVITTIAMFYDLENPNSFVFDVSISFTQNGIWIIQLASLLAMVQNTMFDNICHEHIEHYSLAALEYLLHKHHMQVVDIEENNVNGGSIRVYVMHDSAVDSYTYPGAKQRLAAYRAKEKQYALSSPATYKAFNQRIQTTKHTITTFISKEVKRGKIVYGYGASTKGNTLLQYFQLTKKSIAAIAERNPDKWGKRTVATGIPIVSESEARRTKLDYFLVLPWHFKKEFIEREKTYLKDGGSFLFPLPRPVLVTMESGKIIETPL